jgi:sulfite exporter TauE/SafE
MSYCRVAACRLAQRAGIRGSALLGLFAGILPCLPLLGVLTFTALYARDLWEGAFYGLAFGAGKLFSPLIVLGMLAGSAPALLSRYGRAFSYFAKLCGVVLIVIGISLIVPGLWTQW